MNESWLLVDSTDDCDEHVSAWINPSITIIATNFDQDSFDDEKRCTRKECTKRVNIVTRQVCTYCLVGQVMVVHCSKTCAKKDYHQHAINCKKHSYPRD